MRKRLETDHGGCFPWSKTAVRLIQADESRFLILLRFFLLLGIIIAAVLTETVHAKNSDLLLLQNDSQIISLRYRAPSVQWNPIEISGQIRYEPRIRGTSIDWPEGSPQLPVRVIWLVIPPGKTPVLETAIPYGVNQESKKLAPVPKMVEDADGFVSYKYYEDSALSYPSVWAEISSPRAYRNLNVIRLIIYPLRISGSQNGITAIDSLDVRIRLQGESAVTGGFIRPIEDEFYSGLIGNWSSQAKSWGMPRSAYGIMEDPWPSGDFYRIEIEESGIYKLTYNYLVSAGINPADIIPSRVRIFNNGGRTLPVNIQPDTPDEPIENAILVRDIDGDDIFDQEDQVWFYARSVHEWEWDLPGGRFKHYQNPFTDRNVYWLNINPNGSEGKPMSDLGLGISAWITPTPTRAYVFEEKELYAIFGDFDLPLYMPNLFGEFFSGPSTRTFSFNLTNVITAAPANLTLDFQVESGSGHQYTVYMNGIPLGEVNTSTSNLTIPPNVLFSGSGNNTLRIDHLTDGKVYMDYIEIEYERNLTASSGEIAFISPDQDGVVEYHIGGLSDPWIFDITDFDEVKFTQDSVFKDTSKASSPRRYIALDPGALKTPVSISFDQRSADEYVNLRSSLGADLVVITANEFYNAMSQYEQFRQSQTTSPIEVLRVRISDVYDEFGWGLLDPTAIRDFLRSTRQWAVQPLYVLFVGDGDFDYKNRLAQNDDNWVFPYDSSFISTDDYYVQFDSSGGPASCPELATGRWTVHTVGEVEDLINRLIEYEAGGDYGPWRDRAVFVADDEYGAGGEYKSFERDHVIDTELIAENYIPDILNIGKIYLTEYPSVRDPGGGGTLKPEATDDLIDAINEGCLFVNYIGHGNPSVWTHETVFQQDRDLPLLHNGNKLPLFLAFTCDWAYWDDPFSQSMPEDMLYLNGGGAIAAIAATRLTSSGANETLASNFYDALFPNNGFTTIPLGEALLYAKSCSYSSNSKVYHLLGDPVMKLAVPQLVVYIVSSSTDTLIALDHVAVTGQVKTQSGTPVPTFQGIAHLQVFDNRILKIYFFNGDVNNDMSYYLPGNLIFRGDVTVSNGNFTSSFIVPVDISYGGDEGRFSVYAYSDETDGVGVNSQVVFGDSVVALADLNPPSVKVYFDSPGFRDGDPISPDAVLYVEVSDSNGVNITGSAGHGIVVTIDDGTIIDLTENFSYYLDSYTNGCADYALEAGEISPGHHTAEAIAWDVANNHGSDQISFEVVGFEEFRLTDVLNYPNPFNNSTRFTFVLAGSEADGSDVTIKIYTVAGRLIKVISGIVGRSSYNWDDPGLLWNGRDEQGDLLSNGVYLYKVIVRGIAGGKAEETGKLIVMR